MHKRLSNRVHKRQYTHYSTTMNTNQTRELLATAFEISIIDNSDIIDECRFMIPFTICALNLIRRLQDM